MKFVNFRVAIIWLMSVFWLIPSAWAGIVELDADQSRYNLSLSAQVLKDSLGEKTIEQVIAEQDAWYDNPDNPPNFSFSSDVFWLKLDLRQLDDNTNSKKWLLEVANANQDFLDVYILHHLPNSETRLEHIETGDRRAFSNRALPYRNFLFELDFNQSAKNGARQQIFFRLANKDGLHAPAPLLLWDVETFAYANGDRNMGLGLYLGIMLVMAIYNLFLFMVVRDKTYLYYVGYVVFLVVWLFSYFGFSSQYLWPNHGELGNRLIIVFACLWCSFMLHFVRVFLNTKKQVPWFDKLCWFFIALLYACIVLAVFGSYAFATKVIIVLSLLFCIPCFVGSWQCWRNGYGPARFFILAWAIMLLAMVTFTLKIANVLPAVFVVENALQIGSAIEVTLLSLGLGDRINALKQQKRDAQERALQAAEASNKLKDEFLANTSHELRTPLNGIIGLAESLIDGVAGQLPQKANQNLAMVVNSGRRLSSLVNDLLDFSKLKDNHLVLNTKAVDLYSICDVVLTLSRPLVEEKPLKLINRIDKDLPLVRADEDRLLQVFHNLVGNGIKFSHKGEVCVSAELSPENSKQGVIISVTDTGIGIDDSQFERIFESFQQAEESNTRAYGGTGLGLAVSKQLVELHGGELTVKSVVGEGSCFSFTLPLCDEQEIAQHQQNSHLSQSVSRLNVFEGQLNPEPVAVQGGQLPVARETTQSTDLADSGYMMSSEFHILIVDDEPVNRQVLFDHLAVQNYHLYQASNGEQALEMLEKRQFDLILLDVMMPSMSGYEVCKQIRKNFAVNDLPIIFLTAKTQVSDLVESFSVGGNDYLTKPITKHELLTRVAIHLKLLDINRHLESLVAKRTSELVQAGKMASLGTLTAGVAHEINNPTNFVHVSAQNLKGDLDKFRQYLLDLAGEDAENEVIDSFENQFTDLFEHLITIKEGTNRIIDIVKNLKLFSQLESAEKKNVNISDCLDSTLSLVRTKYMEVTEFITEYQSEGELHCYPAQLNQVFMNLIVNACDAIAQRQQEQQGHIGKVVVACSEHNNQVVVSVSDNGCGMDETTKSKLFEPFFTTKDVGQGTGLGLSISYGIIQKHDGSLDVQSELGRGTQFVVSLPRVDGV